MVETREFKPKHEQKGNARIPYCIVGSPARITNHDLRLFNERVLLGSKALLEPRKRIIHDIVCKYITIENIVLAGVYCYWKTSSV